MGVPTHGLRSPACEGLPTEGAAVNLSDWGPVPTPPDKTQTLKPWRPASGPAVLGLRLAAGNRSHPRRAAEHILEGLLLGSLSQPRGLRRGSEGPWGCVTQESQGGGPPRNSACGCGGESDGASWDREKPHRGRNGETQQV